MVAKSLVEGSLRVARVFPRRTKASPDDELAFFGPPGLFPPEVDRVEISVAFTWDRPAAERLAAAWERVAPVTIGGPAYGAAGGEFEPGRYLRRGYVITSRGCPNRCWFCSVWKREPALLELPIRDGSNVLDDNLLACSERHVRAVFEMLGRQRNPVQFSGGLEAARLEPWHVDLLARLRPKQAFFAYDTADDLEPLRAAAKLLGEAALLGPARRIRAFVLCGFRGDTFEAAERRFRAVLELDVWPMAMLYRDENGRRDPAWMRFQKYWARPAYIARVAVEGIRPK
jgi:hypothetical protein